MYRTLQQTPKAPPDAEIHEHCTATKTRSWRAPTTIMVSLALGVGLALVHHLSQRDRVCTTQRDIHHRFLVPVSKRNPQSHDIELAEYRCRCSHSDRNRRRFSLVSSDHGSARQNASRQCHAQPLWLIHRPPYELKVDRNRLVGRGGRSRRSREPLPKHYAELT
jgi:hypothetical protein